MEIKINISKSMKWTKDLPKVSGYYWGFSATRFIRNIIYVSVKGAVLEILHEGKKCEDVSNYDYWIGPLDPPRLPRRGAKNRL